MKYISLVLLALCIIQMKSDKASDVVSFAKSKLGCGYVWGGEGQVLNKKNMQQFKSQYPTHVDTNVVKKWIGKQIYDCSGLVMKAFQTVGIKIYHNCEIAWKRTSWASKGQIKNYPKNKVCIVYRYSGGKMVHTGISLGNGEFIHAKGSAYGVVKEKMPGSWTHWGIPKGLY